ncbi:unnamed protein product [Microthlaspi erraticum]|uniref:Uncharacterized protein n=1 Tax=Microthlaspi erraticum TaxID=1685480 RepID=A0A6D2LBE4_9BRAS|nr:unnamed protein product [Microthlaspi erraticum]
MEQPARKRPGHRPLETCGGAMLATVRVVYTRTQTPKNPASYFLQKLYKSLIFLVSLTSPIHRHLLAILSIADDHILAFQDTIETYFPSSTSAFLKISDLLTIAERFPNKLDGFLKKLPGLMSRAAWIDWMLIHAIYWLGSLVNLLGRWRDKNKGTSEKEITVDKSFSRSGSSISEEEEEKNRLEKKATYKEALQRGSSGEDGGGSTGRSSRGDPILELFENGWIQNPIKRSSKSADSLTFSRSDSYETST